jgi:hypothetical protein
LKTQRPRSVIDPEQAPRRLGGVSRESGFTLIEVIAIIVAAGLVGVLFTSILGKNLSRSIEPVIWTQHHHEMVQAVEKITAVHKKLMATNGDTALGSLKTLIENGTLVDLSQYTVQTKYIAFDGANSEKTSAEGDATLKVVITRKSDLEKIVMVYAK